MNYRLIIIRFDYTNNLSCHWPIVFEVTQSNSFGERERDILNQAIEELRSIPGITNAEVVHDKLADLTEVIDTFNVVLQINPEEDNIQIKYLELDVQRMATFPRFDFDDSRYYLPIQFKKFLFPVRVRSHRFRMVLDDLVLPILMTELKNE